MISIVIDDLIKDPNNFLSLENNWLLTAELISQEINSQTKNGISDAMRCDFTTTTSIERAASNIIILDSMK